jgi:hypothetical protein
MPETASKLEESLLKIQQVERDWSRIKLKLKHAYPLNRTIDLTKHMPAKEPNVSSAYKTIEKPL